MFKVGDTVFHMNDPERGHGTVVRLYPGFHRNHQQADVQWDENTTMAKIFNGQNGLAFGHNAEFLVLIQTELQYNPEQQGDTEDDI